MYFLVHKHVLSRSGPKLGHPNWVVQIPDVFGESVSNTDADADSWRYPDRNSNPDSNSNANANSWRNTNTNTNTNAYGYGYGYTYAYTESVANRSGSDVKPATRLNVHVLKRHVPVECG